ncbi:hypothetical protein Tsubulata_049071 [Turnera subulata]|uniref:DYW domain-containing protein n=1 Tax=Turnera subulata TaxID=218843 RepID=A0A9Q0J9C5_9ROSI|nr:hypothetical protein Tsubulata_049071 [Turnera subulata]
MASLPSSVSLTSTLKFQPQLNRLSSPSLPTEKNPSIPWQRSHINTKLDGNSKPMRGLEYKEALSLIRDGKKVEPSCYLPLLQQCIDKKSASETQILHAHMIKTGTHQDVFVMTFLVNVYAKCGAVSNAQKVLANLPERNVVSWTALMSGYIQDSKPEVAIQLFVEMLESETFPSNLTLAIALNACSSLNSIELARQFHAFIVKYKADHDTSIGNTLCRLYSKFQSLGDAIKAFQKIEEKDVISWTGMMSSCEENSRAATGLKFFPQMLVEGVKPNELTLASVLSMCNITMSLGLGRQVHSLCIKLGHISNSSVSNSIMYLYFKCGCTDNTENLVDKKGPISIITWNAMIAGHSQAMSLAEDDHSAYGIGVEALNIFLNLNRSGIKPDAFTLSSILTVCRKMLAIELGEQVHAHTLKSGFLSDVVVGTALVNMYSKCGSIERARKAFLEMPSRSLISWTSMINSLAQHGYSQQALQLFEDMRLAEVRPNEITFVGVLAACSRAGMVKEALEYFKMMQKEYKFKPLSDHYGCLIDMFVRLGRLDEAFDTVKKMESMQLEPNESTWLLLIAGCRNHGNDELGLYAAEQLLNLKPKNTQTYVILLNFYIAANRWKDVSRVRKLMKAEKVGKLKDWSRISIKGKVYSFKTSRRLHPRNKEIYKLLDELLDKAKSMGYEFDDNTEEMGVEDNDEDEKESGKMVPSAIYHSEKLAVAFGLLNTPNNAPIRVTKSISMCKDCHTFFRAISSMTNREIIVRDSKKLRKFVSGQSSLAEFGNAG